jgi:hypothetical protein
LRDIRLTGNSLADDDIAELASCQTLEHISLDKTQVSNRVFDTLDRLPNLRSVALPGWPITKDAEDNYRRKHPNVMVSIMREY